MTKTKQRYRETSTIKRKKGVFAAVKTVAFFLLCLGVVVFAAGSLSGLITIPNFNLLFWVNNNPGASEHSYYAVSLGQFSNAADAERVSSEAMQLGAAGYVFKSNDVFYVLGNIYEKQADAETVKNNLIAEGTTFTVTVLPINYKKVSLEASEFTKEQKDLLNESFTFFNQVFVNVYDNIIKLDKREITVSRFSSDVNSLKSEAKIMAGRLDVLNAGLVTQEGIKIKSAYTRLIDCLDTFVLKLISVSNVNAESKYSLIEIALIQYELVQTL